MKLRHLSLADVVVVIVVAVALFLPARRLSATPVGKVDDHGRRALAFAEARVEARPGDGPAVYELVRLLGDAKLSDWAVQAAAVAAGRATESPTHWRALLAVSVAHVDRYEAKEALDYATQALAACARAAATTCPSWEQVRVELYQRHLDAGVRSGINPRQNPIAFRQAGEAALRQVRTMGTGIAPQPQPQPPAP
ncbi:MAG: hypothetical protein IPL61_15225 [Myxococcales bacterium]|nr:hypothetical protein [Myxococcales bacterium]